MERTNTILLNCLIVDDEPLAREVIQRYVERTPSLQLVSQCSNALEAMPVLQQHEVHLLFLDIQMPEILGTEFIRALKNPPKIIITTAYPQYAIEGYELDVTDYLLKPVSFERFLKAIHKALPQISRFTQLTGPPEKLENNKNPYLYFRSDRKMMKVMVSDIIYIEGMKNYIRVITDQGVIITKNSISAAEALLPPDVFIRVHRSYIVLKSRIQSFTSEFVAVGKTQIPIGKLFKNEVMKALSH